MNNKLFASMQDQMAPSAEAVDGLKQQLTSAAPVKKRRPVGAYAVVAACAALALLIYPVSRMAGAGQGQSGKLHSYVTVDSASAGVASGQQTMTGGVEAGGSGVTGSYTGDLNATDHTGDPPAATSNAPVDPGSALDPTDYTGETIPGGAMVEAPTPISPDAALEGPAAEAYQNLMSYFSAEYGKDAYPGWYGGAYLQGSTLIVCVVDANVPAEYLIDAGGDMIPGKEFYLQIQKWADSTSIGYSSAKYSMSFLQDLQRQITELPELKALSSWGCGANDMTNQVELDVPEVNDALLAALARLDPDDDAILVRLGTISLANDVAAAPVSDTITGAFADMDR